MKYINFNNKKIFIAGKNGLLGSAIFRLFKNKEPNSKLLSPSSSELDLTSFVKTEKWFKKNKPDYVILAAAKAAGILDNTNSPTTYMVDNIKDLPYEIKKGTRLFQIISPALLPIQFNLVTELDSTSRGSGGFGSTNTNNDINNEIDQVNVGVSPFSIGNRRERQLFEFNG